MSHLHNQILDKAFSESYLCPKSQAFINLSMSTLILWAKRGEERHLFVTKALNYIYTCQVQFTSNYIQLTTMNSCVQYKISKVWSNLMEDALYVHKYNTVQMYMCLLQFICLTFIFQLLFLISSGTRELTSLFLGQTILNWRKISKMSSRCCLH